VVSGCVPRFRRHPPGDEQLQLFVGQVDGGIGQQGTEIVDRYAGVVQRSGSSAAFVASRQVIVRAQQLVRR
jgi:hypothetical protein